MIQVVSGTLAWILLGALTLRVCVKLSGEKTIDEFQRGTDGEPVPAIPVMIVLIWPFVIALVIVIAIGYIIVFVVKWIVEADLQTVRIRSRLQKIERHLSDNEVRDV